MRVLIWCNMRESDAEIIGFMLFLFYLKEKCLAFTIRTIYTFSPFSFRRIVEFRYL